MRIYLILITYLSMLGCGETLKNDFDTLASTCGEAQTNTTYIRLFDSNGKQVESKDIRLLSLGGVEIEARTTSKGCIGWSGGSVQQQLTIGLKDKLHLYSGVIVFDRLVPVITLSKRPLIEVNRQAFSSWLSSICSTGRRFLSTPQFNLSGPSFIGSEEAERLFIEISLDDKLTKRLSLTQLSNPYSLTLGEHDGVYRLTLQLTDAFGDRTIPMSCEINVNSNLPQLIGVNGKEYFPSKQLDSEKSELSIDFSHETPLTKLFVSFDLEGSNKNYVQEFVPFRWQDENTWKVIVPFPFERGEWDIRFHVIDEAGLESEQYVYRVDRGMQIFNEGSVWTLELDTKNRLLLFGDDTGQVHIRDLDNLHEVGKLNTGERVQDIEKIPNSDLFLLMGVNKLFLLDVKNQNILANLKFENTIYFTDVNANGTYVLVRDIIGSFYIVAVVDGSKLVKINTKIDSVTNFSWIDTQQFLVTRTDGSFAALNINQKIQSEAKICGLEQAKDSFVDRENAKVFVVCGDGRLFEYTIDTEKIRLVSKFENGEPTKVRLSKNKRYAVIALNNGNWFVFDLYNNELSTIDSLNETTSDSQHEAYIRAVKFTDDERYILTASEDRSGKLYDLERKQVIAAVNHKDVVTEAEYDQNNGRFITASLDGFVRIKQVPVLDAKITSKAPISNLLPLESAQLLFTVGQVNDDTFDVNLLDFEGRTHATLKAVHHGHVNSIEFDQTRNLIITGSEDKLVRIFAIDLNHKTIESKEVLEFEKAVHLTKLKNDYLLILVGARAYVYKLDDLTEPYLVIENKGWLDFADFSSLGHYVLTGGSDGVLQVYDIKTKSLQFIKKITEETLSHFVFDSYERKLGLTSWDGSYKVFDFDKLLKQDLSDPLISNTSKLGNFLSAMVLDRYFLSLSWDNTIKVIDYTLDYSYTIDCIGSSLKDVSILKDGNLAAFSTRKGEVYLFNIANGKFIQKIKHPTEIQSMHLLDQGKRIVTSSQSGLIYMHQIVLDGNEICE